MAPEDLRELDGAYAGSMFQHSRGRVWASTLGEFGYLENDHFIVVRNVSGGPVYSITEHTFGNLWIAIKDFSLIHLLHGGDVQRIPWERLEHGHALALA